MGMDSFSLASLARDSSAFSMAARMDADLALSLAVDLGALFPAEAHDVGEVREFGQPEFVGQSAKGVPRGFAGPRGQGEFPRSLRNTQESPTFAATSIACRGPDPARRSRATRSA